MSARPTRTELREFIVERFSRDEFNLLCRDHFDRFYTTNQGSPLTMQQLSQELVDYCERRDVVEALIKALQKERPKPWENTFGPPAPSPEDEITALKDKLKVAEEKIAHLTKEIEALKAAQPTAGPSITVWIPHQLKADSGLAREGFSDIRGYDPLPVIQLNEKFGYGVLVYPATSAQDLSQLKTLLTEQLNIPVGKIGLVVYKEGERIEGGFEALKGFGPFSFANFPSTIAQQVKSVSQRLTA